MIQNNTQATPNYLKLIDCSRHFSSAILKMLIKDHRTAHTERITNNMNLVVLKSIDIVMARTAIQIDISKKNIVKLCYTVRSPFQIIRNTEHSSYIVRKINKHDNPEFSFMAYELYPLPPSLKPYKPFDTIYSRYLNQSHTPLVNPWKKIYTSNFTMNFFL